MSPLDQSIPLAVKGYAWLPDLRRRAHGRPVSLRVLGQPAIAIGGPEAARFFYAENHLSRHPAAAALFGEAPCTPSTARPTGTARRCSSRS